MLQRQADLPVLPREPLSAAFSVDDVSFDSGSSVFSSVAQVTVRATGGDNTAATGAENVQCSDSADEGVSHRWLMHHVSMPVAAGPKRSSYAVEAGSTTDVVLAFPMMASAAADVGDGDAGWSDDPFGVLRHHASAQPSQLQQQVFSFLPVSSYGLPFTLQADWVLPPSREIIAKIMPGTSGWLKRWCLMLTSAHVAALNACSLINFS